MTRPNPNGEAAPSSTFEYEVRLEWGPRTERHHMNRIAEIAEFVGVQLADIGVTDAHERPEPNIARITIERIVPTPAGNETG